MSDEGQSFSRILKFAPTHVIEETLPKLSPHQRELAEKELAHRKEEKKERKDS